jgi:hypothetical protein
MQSLFDFHSSLNYAKTQRHRSEFEPEACAFSSQEHASTEADNAEAKVQIIHYTFQSPTESGPFPPPSRFEKRTALSHREIKDR